MLNMVAVLCTVALTDYLLARAFVNVGSELWVLGVGFVVLIKGV